MKKNLIIIFVSMFCMIFTGCGEYDSEDLVKDFSKKVGDSISYNLNGVLEIKNNEETYSYDVEVSYKKENNFKVSLKNRTNNYEQIILRNSDGVYVLTPSINKSFKFQSEWPYNSSQSYLLQTIVEDMTTDDDINFEQTDEGYIIETQANYSANKDLKTQKIYFNNEKEIYKVEVLDEEGITKILMNISSVEYNKNFDDSYFKLNTSLDESTVKENSSSSIDQIIYPMYMPENTYLSSENKVAKENGERVIMTFSGDNSFILIQETAVASKNFSTISVDGDPYLLGDTICVVGENSVEWINNGIEYYLVSDKLSQNEMLNVARSLSVMPVGK